MPILAHDTGLADWGPAIAAGLAALVALVSLPVGHYLQGRRERRNWATDRRLDAYADLVWLSAEVASATETPGRIASQVPSVPIPIYADAQAKWERAHHQFGAAQARAALVASTELVSLIEEMSRITHDMIDASVRAAPKVDAAGQILGPADQTALNEMEALAAESIDLRSELLRTARRDITGPPRRRRPRQPVPKGQR